MFCFRSKTLKLGKLEIAKIVSPATNDTKKGKVNALHTGRLSVERTVYRIDERGHTFDGCLWRDTVTQIGDVPVFAELFCHRQRQLFQLVLE